MSPHRGNTKGKDDLKQPLLDAKDHSLNSGGINDASPPPTTTTSPFFESPDQQQNNTTTAGDRQASLLLDALLYQESQKTKEFSDKRESVVKKLGYSIICVEIVSFITSVVLWYTMYFDGQSRTHGGSGDSWGKLFSKWSYDKSLIDVICIFFIRMIFSIIDWFCTKSDQQRYTSFNFATYWIGAYALVLFICKLIILKWSWFNNANGQHNVGIVQQIFIYLFSILNLITASTLVILQHRYAPLDVDNYQDDELEAKELLKRQELHQQQVDVTNEKAKQLLEAGLTQQYHELMKHEQQRCERYEEIESELKRQRVAAKQLSDNTSWTQLISLLKPYFWPQGLRYKLTSLLVWAVLIGSKACSLYSPLFIGQAVDILQKEHKLPIREIILYSLLTLGSLVLKQIQNAIYLPVRQQGFIVVSRDLMEHTLNLSISWHHSTNIGKTTRSIDRGISSIENVVQYFFLLLLPSMFEAVSIFIIFFQHFQLPLVTATLFFSLTTYLIATILLTNLRSPIRKKARSYDNKYHEIIVDSLSQIELVKSYAIEERKTKEYVEAIDAYQKSSVLTQVTLSLLNSVQSTIIQLCLLCSLIIVAIEVKNGRLSVGAVASCAAFVTAMFSPLSWVGTIYDSLMQGFVDAAQLIEIRSQQPAVADAPDAKPLKLDKQRPPAVEFRNVTFTYPKSNRGLTNVSFKVQPGERVAIVGSSGASKSTTLRLISRLYDPDEGQILIDGQDIRHVTLKSLKDSIVQINQEGSLLSTSILDNLLVGHPNATNHEIITACDMAGILEFVLSLPLSFYTNVGSRGQKLSGGEKQRVCFAMALLKRMSGANNNNNNNNDTTIDIDNIFNNDNNNEQSNNNNNNNNNTRIMDDDSKRMFMYGGSTGRIILADEPTSAVSVLNEKIITRSLDLLSSNTTLITVTHRLNFVASYDRIIVFEAGRIVEEGSHEELLQKQDGQYRAMFLSQFIDGDDSQYDGGGMNDGTTSIDGTILPSGLSTNGNTMNNNNNNNIDNDKTLRDNQMAETLLSLHKLGNKNRQKDNNNNNTNNSTNTTTVNSTTTTTMTTSPSDNNIANTTTTTPSPPISAGLLPQSQSASQIANATTAIGTDAINNKNNNTTNNNNKDLKSLTIIKPSSTMLPTSNTGDGKPSVSTPTSSMIGDNAKDSREAILAKAQQSLGMGEIYKKIQAQQDQRGRGRRGP